jgi:hypothetical protein
LNDTNEAKHKYPRRWSLTKHGYILRVDEPGGRARWDDDISDTSVGLHEAQIEKDSLINPGGIVEIFDNDVNLPESPDSSMADILLNTMRRIDATITEKVNSPRYRKVSELICAMRDADSALYAQLMANERFAVAFGELAALADGGAV